MFLRAEPYRTVLRNWEAALSARDAASLASLHVMGSVLLPPDRPSIKEPGPIRDTWEEWFAEPGWSLELDPLSIRVYPSGDIASADAGYRMTHGSQLDSRVDTGRLLIVAVQSHFRWGIRFNAFFSDDYLRRMRTLKVLAG